MNRKKIMIGDKELKVPVFQGGMGVGISLSSLASAVAREGGVGVISSAQIGFREPDFDKNLMEANFRALRNEIRKAKENSNGGIIGVNAMVAGRNYEDIIKICVEEEVDIIISGAGLPTKLPTLVEGSNVKIAPVVSSDRALEVIVKMWKKKNRVPDAIIIEGPKAGGHLGFGKEELDNIDEYDIKNIFEKVKLKMKELEIDCPVVVGGGVHTKEEMKRVLEFGADAIQIGTRFVTTEECDANIKLKEAYVNAKEEDLVIIKSPVGMLGRAIKNKLIERVAKEGRIAPTKCYACVSKCKPNEAPFCLTRALINAAEGNIDEALLFAGTGAIKADKIEKVSDIMNEVREIM